MLLASASGAQEFSGVLDDARPRRRYIIDLQAGQAVLAVVTPTSGSLDTVLQVEDPTGTIIAENDDRNPETLGSAVTFTAQMTGTYTMIVSRYELSNSSGTFDLNITVGDEAEFVNTLADLERIELSGEQIIIDTEHFRIHYTLEGEDATTEEYAQRVADTVEKVWQIQVEQMGWPPPPADDALGADGRYDVYIADLADDVSGGILGYADPQSSPEDPSEASGMFGSTSFFVIENDFSEIDDPNFTPISLMRSTAAHEFHHGIQIGFDSDEPHSWYYEATSTWMETVTFPEDESASIYIDDLYDFPEICFGTETGPLQGLNRYGDWLFIQSLVDYHGEDIVREIWTNIADFEGFAALEKTLEQRGDTVPEALARYRVQNLARDYDLAPLFGNTVWIENRIEAEGRWSFDGEGIQELAANYYEVALKDMTYRVTLGGDDGQMQIWGLGVRDNQVFEFPLGHSGFIAPGQYDHYYLMVFNPVYDDNVNHCTYESYTIDVFAEPGEVAEAARVWDARYFEVPDFPD